MGWMGKSQVVMR